MPTKKARLSQLLSMLQLSPAIRRLRAATLDEITILAYHRVLASWSEENFEFDLDLISASVEDFRWQMQFVKKNYTPITFETLINQLDIGAPLPPKPLIVTFDDGFDDNYHHAFPVLRDLGMPATIFISTGYIGQKRTFWFDWLYYLCKRELSHRPIRFMNITIPAAQNADQLIKVIGDLFDYAKRLPDDTLRAALTTLENELNIQYPTNGFSDSLPLTWDQVREMASRGIEFGSHTVTHPVLANLTPPRLAEELAESKKCLERELGRPALTLSYPDGGDFAFNDDVINAAKHAGYRLGASYINGTNRAHRLENFRLKRLHVERYTSRVDFEGMLTSPEFLA